MAGIKTLLVCVVVSGIVLAAGSVGTWAFNPDHGAVAQNHTAWQVFGISAYLGFFASVLFVFALLIAAVVAALRGELRSRTDQTT